MSQPPQFTGTEVASILNQFSAGAFRDRIAAVFHAEQNVRGEWFTAWDLLCSGQDWGAAAPPSQGWQQRIRNETLDLVLRGLRSEDDSTQLRAIIASVEHMRAAVPPPQLKSPECNCEMCISAREHNRRLARERRAAQAQAIESFIASKADYIAWAEQDHGRLTVEDVETLLTAFVAASPPAQAQESIEYRLNRVLNALALELPSDLHASVALTIKSLFRELAAPTPAQGWQPPTESK